MEEKQWAYKSMREVQGGRVRQNAQMYKPLTQYIQVRCLVWYFDQRTIPGTSHKLRLFWAGSYRVMKRRNRGGDQRTTRGSRKTWITSWTNLRYPNDYCRSKNWKRRSTWENSSWDPTQIQGGGDGRKSNVRDSIGMECGPRSDNGGWRWSWKRIKSQREMK